MMPTTLLLPRLWVNGNLPGAFLILDTTELPLICWTILMSSEGRTRHDDTSRPFRTYAGTPDGSWPVETGCSVTFQSGFSGSTGMSRHGPGLLQTLRLLRQMTWLRPSRSLLYMSSAISRGVIQFRITSRGLILGGTWYGSLKYHILYWTPLRPFLTTQPMLILVLSLLTRRFLLSSGGPDILPTHTRSSATSEPKYTVHWGILMCFIIWRRLFAWYREYNLSGACCNRCRLRRGGVEVHGMEQYDFCVVFYDTLLDLVVILLHLRFLADLWRFSLFYSVVFRNLIMTSCLIEWMLEWLMKNVCNYWMNEGMKILGKIEVLPVLASCTDWVWVNSHMC